MKKTLIIVYLLLVIPFTVFATEYRKIEEEITIIYSTIEAARAAGWNILDYKSCEDFSISDINELKEKKDNQESFVRLLTDNPDLGKSKMPEVEKIFRAISDSESNSENNYKRLFENLGKVTQFIFPKYMYSPSLRIVIETNNLYIEREFLDLRTYNDNLLILIEEMKDYNSKNSIFRRLTWPDAKSMIDPQKKLSKSSSIIATLVDDFYPLASSGEENVCSSEDIAQRKYERLTKMTIPEILEAMEDKAMKISELLSFYNADDNHG